MEKSAVDILAENLTELGYKPETNTSNRTFIIPGTDRFLSSKFVVCMLTDNIFFLASDSLGTRAYTSSTFTGIYSKIELPDEVEFKIVKKDWFDFLFSKRKKSNISYIDNNLTITSSNWTPGKELNKENVELFLTLNRRKHPYFLIVENDYCPKIEALKGKKVIGLETNNWIYEKEDVKHLIDLGVTLVKRIKNGTENT